MKNPSNNPKINMIYPEYTTNPSKKTKKNGTLPTAKKKRKGKKKDVQNTLLIQIIQSQGCKSYNEWLTPPNINNSEHEAPPKNIMWHVF